MPIQQDIDAAGSEIRPPMLNKENYVPWSSRLLRYAKSRPNGKLIHNSILIGPYVRKLIPKPGDANRDITPVPNSRQRLHLLHMDLCGPMRIASMNGKRYILVIVDDYSRYTWVHFLRSKDEAPGVIIKFLKRITVLLQIYNRRTKKIMETMNVSFDELSAMAFEQRSSKPGLQCMTSGQISLGLDLTFAPSTITTQQPTEGELDSLFKAMYDDYFSGQPSANVENVPPAQEPQVRQTTTASTTIADNVPIPTNSSSHTTNIQITSQDVEELNPNAMVDGNTFVNPFSISSTSAAQASSSSQNVIQNAVQNPRVQNIRNHNGLIGVQGNGNHNQIRNGNLVAARTEGNAAGQNGNQIRCYNCRGKEDAGIQLQAEEYDLIAVVADLDKIEEVNANYILMAASTSGTQTDSVPFYDTDGSAKVHENYDNNEIFNMFTQEEQYTEILEPIPESHQVPQNDNVVISEDTSVEQGGETVEQHPVKFEETRTLYESLYHNLAIEVEKV
nr:ribonuclease H-like domain-containing protein [Tanacetum cinerariifolium]